MGVYSFFQLYYVLAKPVLHFWPIFFLQALRNTFFTLDTAGFFALKGLPIQRLPESLLNCVLSFEHPLKGKGVSGSTGAGKIKFYANKFVSENQRVMHPAYARTCRQPMVCGWAYIGVQGATSFLQLWQ